MNEFIIQIDSILNTFLCPGTTLQRTRGCQGTCPRSCGPRTGSGSAAAATRRPSRPSTTAPTPSSSAASATSGSRWATGRTTSPPPGSSPVPAERPSPRRHRPGAAGPGAAGPGGSSRLTRRCPSASASTSHPPHRQRQLTLEPFFLASLPGFLHTQGKHLQAATRNATAGRPPGNGTTPSSPLAATKKLRGALWAPYDRGACTSTARDTRDSL